MNYNVDYYITKLGAIPEILWCTGVLTMYVKRFTIARHCALGHCGYGEFYDTSDAIIHLFIDYLGSGIIGVNDGADQRYQQATPKARIMAALYDIKAAQEAEQAVKQAQQLIDNPKTLEPCMM